MATTIKLKNGSGAPAASDLVQGEPAIDLTNKRLYTENASGVVIEVGSNPSSLSINGTAVTATAAEINTLDGITSSTAELNILDGVTSTAAELNILDGVTASTAEINLLDGVTSTTAELNILDGVTSTAAELNILDGVTSTTAELNILDGVTSTAAELNILDGVTSTTAELNILDGVTATAAELNVLDGVTAFVDEDDMSSNSATSIPSQQSVKAYVDTTVAAEVTAQDLDFQGDSGGALSIDLDSETLTIAGGTGVDTSGSGNTLTVAIDSTVATLTGSQTLTNKTLTSPVLNTGVSGTAVLDEDDMSSNSATQLATQQSIKAYVDSQVDSADTLAELTDTNITSPADAALLFYDTGTSKWIDNVVSGDITIADTGVAAIGAGVIVNADVKSDAAISVSKTALVDGTGLTLTGDTLSVDASQTQITAVGTIGTGTWQGSVITNTYVADDLTINGGTIENTPIGASTANTGEFTTLEAATGKIARPSTFWSTGYVGIPQYGGISTEGNFDLHFTVNGYRNSSGTWTSHAINSKTGAAQIALDPDGEIGFNTEASKANGDSLVVTRRVTIDADGKVGIGETNPSVALHVNGGGSNTLALFESTDAGAAISFKDGDTTTNPELDCRTNDLVFNTGGTERVRIDSDGNVGIGISDPAEILHLSKSSAPILKIENTDTSLGSDQVIGAIQWKANDPSGSGVGDCAQIAVRSGSTVGGQCYMQFTTSDSSSLNQERMRLDSTGSLCVGEVTSDIKGRVHAFASDTRCHSARFTGANGSSIGYWSEFDNTSGDAYHVYLRYNNSQVGLISSNSTTTTYGTSSDERLKENIVDAPAGNIDDVRVRSFDWRVDGTHQTYGVIAQEIVDVAPEAVTKGKTEDDMWQVDYSKLVPMMIKEIQDLKAKVAELESR